jgi:hypothetical protein
MWASKACLEFRCQTLCIATHFKLPKEPSLWHEEGAQCIADDAAFEILVYSMPKKPFFGQTIQLFCHIWFFVLHRPDSSRDLCRTDYSSFVTLFSLLLHPADVLCLDGLGTFDLFIIPGVSYYRGTEIGEENATVINGKECLDDSRTHLFRVVQAF